MKIAVTTMRFLLDGEEGDDSRTAIYAVEVEIERLLGINPATILVVQAIPDPDVANGWDVSIQLPGNCR